MNKSYDFDWSDLAFASKKPLRDLKAAFIAAPRDISGARFKQLVKEFLPVGNIVLGVAKEPYIDGFEDQPQFRTLQLATVQPVIDLVNKASNQHKVYTLSYAQRELPYLFEKPLFRRVVLVNGSWKHTFHTQPAYYALVRQGTPYDLVPAFASEQEARGYETRIMPEIAKLHDFQPGPYTEAEMLAKASEAAVYSFDYSHQTGVSLGRAKGKKYELLGWAYNRVVPFQTYALYYGASREVNFSPPHDLNHYDTLHAEVEMIVQAQKRGLDLHGTTLFINLLPCPACARMFTETDIDEFVYSIDHSEGYAVKMLEAAGKKVRRVVL
ncbi:MAG TPA: deaminase [Candidatus Saccharimonadales bacterium]